MDTQGFMDGKYHEDWSSVEDINRDFNNYDGKNVFVTDDEVLFAAYTYENYSGDAYVLFKRNGKLYEVHGGHCSCYGLEGQWEPEEVEIEALKHRLEKSSWGIVYDNKEKILEAIA